MSLSIKLVLPVLVLIISNQRSLAQTYLYFQDSKMGEYYEYSWMELTAPSELERKGSELRRFPVETKIFPHRGLNCLKLTWKSVAGGDWVAIAAGNNWQEYDVSETDSLSFWLYSPEWIDSLQLPKIFLEDIFNTKTTKHIFSDRCVDLPDSQWIKVSIPMSLFFDAGDLVDYTKIKTIGFAQNTTEGQEHTLLIDDMRIFTGDGISPAVTTPEGLSAEGGDCHIDLSWNPSPEADVSGYEIHRSADGGNTYQVVAITGENDTHYIDWVKGIGDNPEIKYWIAALNASNDPSGSSDTVSSSIQPLDDEKLLDMLQRYTFRYFWDFAHPLSGMTRERNTSENTVTTGGSGFGVMAIIVGIERGFISRGQGLQRMHKILDFLTTADRFHGAWPHWLDGNTGKTVPFTTYDNGGDLVETAYMIQGLLTAKQYFNLEDADEQSIRQKIATLWDSVEWDWYRKNNSDVLYWHWSPDYNWKMNMQIRGWNEAAITYLLAIASPTHGIPESLWETGWAGSSYYDNGKSFYGYKLDVGWDYGGPLFFSHYSFLGFDPRFKKDSHTNYFRNNRNHTLINRAYCIQNPFGFSGYGTNCWGLTASDDPDGYKAHEPGSGNDNGTITPSAALSSMPYTPEESINAFKYFYRELGNKIWGWMGFYDAFNPQRNWYADSYLAIDQGPIIIMIENYRSETIWNTFMANTEIQAALDAIGFTEDYTGIEDPVACKGLHVYPNPAESYIKISFNLPCSGITKLEILDLSGRTVSCPASGNFLNAGDYTFDVNTGMMMPGIYIVKLYKDNGLSEIAKLVIHSVLK